MDQAVLECVKDAFDDDEKLDEEARREWEEICAQKPLTAKSEVVTSTDRERARAWARWEAWVYPCVQLDAATNKTPKLLQEDLSQAWYAVIHADKLA
ncbi:hypothetical protein PG997_005506 [Apiospora hydei]|uniref:Uncharacterized protein n=1 Tax=Apiospora hydei TaxID=1337664 RepID=A0ABR1WKZ9_9PEZI